MNTTNNSTINTKEHYLGPSRKTRSQQVLKDWFTPHMGIGAPTAPISAAVSPRLSLAITLGFDENTWKVTIRSYVNQRGKSPKKSEDVSIKIMKQHLHS